MHVATQRTGLQRAPHTPTRLTGGQLVSSVSESLRVVQSVPEKLLERRSCRDQRGGQSPPEVTGVTAPEPLWPQTPFTMNAGFTVLLWMRWC